MQAAQLDVVLGRDGDFQVRLEAVPAAAELGLRVGEDRLVAGHLHRSRLVRGRPEFPAADVAQVAPVAPAITGTILAPACNRRVVQAAVAATGRSEARRVGNEGEST